MQIKPTIAAKLALAYVLFLAPIATLGFQMIADKEANIAFATKEITGVHYIAAIQAVQDAVARGGASADWAGQVSTAQQTLGGELKTADSAQALLGALQHSDPVATTQAAADLIGKAADGSNLTLDPDLDSFYTQDALTVKLPQAVAGAVALAAATQATAGHALSVADQVSIGVQTGALQPTVDGLVSDIASAVGGNPDRSVDGAMTGQAAAVAGTAKAALAGLADHRNAAGAAALIEPMLVALTAAHKADGAEVVHLLQNRIAGFRAAEAENGGLALALFMAALAYVVVVVQRGTVSPLQLLTRTMRRLADRDLAADVAGIDRADEVGDMARAVLVFKDGMIAADQLAAEQAQARQKRAAQQDAMAAQTEAFGVSLSAATEGLRQSAVDMRGAAHAMDTALATVREHANETSAGATRSADDLNAVAVSVEQLTSSFTTIADRISGAADTARTAAQRASESQVVIDGPDPRHQPDRRCSGLDYQYCGPDQSAGPERHDRGGPRRRCGQGICRGGQRGEGAGQPDRAGHRGHYPACGYGCGPPPVPR